MLTFSNAATNIVFDGNSLLAGAATSVQDRIGEKLMVLPPINGNMTYTNVALNGQTFPAMIANHSDVDAAYQPGKQNLLFVLEGANTSTMTHPDGSPFLAADLIQLCKDYIDAVKGANPGWRVYLIIAIAMQDDQHIPSDYNAAIDGYNAYVRANFALLGAEGFVETRPPGGPLAYSPPYVYTETTFKKSGLYADGVHLNEAGNAIVAQYMADLLPTIPDVAPVPGGAKRHLRAGGKALSAGGKILMVN